MSLSKKLKIVSISSEVDPFSKTGGLADVACSLPRALRHLGHKVVVITPLYGKIIDKKKFNLKLIQEGEEIIIDEKNKQKVNFWQGELSRGLPIYFIENEKYFSSKQTLYGSSYENARFLLFDLASLYLLIHLKFYPDIVHCHDWHTGLIPYFLKKDFKENEISKNTATVFTIHNLSFQLGHNWWEIPNGKKDDGYKSLPYFDDPEIENINFAKRGILNADIINTVSEQYAEEILTKDFGQDLHIILKNRKDKVFGIINGIDNQIYNPQTDPGLYQKYDDTKLNLKVKNKLALQKELKLPQEAEVPLIAMVTRVAEQKGFDLLIPIFKTLMGQSLQFVILGSGDKKYEQFLQKTQKKHPKKFTFHEFDTKIATLFYAASDMFLMPSRYEPCGLGQMISLRYGSIPIVRATGGLVETISGFNPKTGEGNGFVFKHYSSYNLLMAITRALETYKYKNVWEKIVKNGMKLSYTWEVPAKKYLTLYRKALRNKKKEAELKSNNKL